MHNIPELADEVVFCKPRGFAKVLIDHARVVIGDQPPTRQHYLRLYQITNRLCDKPLSPREQDALALELMRRKLKALLPPGEQDALALELMRRKLKALLPPGEQEAVALELMRRKLRALGRTG